MKLNELLKDIKPIQIIGDAEVEITGVDANATAVTITATNNSHTDTISVKCVAGT